MMKPAYFTQCHQLDYILPFFPHNALFLYIIISGGGLCAPVPESVIWSMRTGGG